jgi:hypothetical protein
MALSLNSRLTETIGGWISSWVDVTWAGIGFKIGRGMFLWAIALRLVRCVGSISFTAARCDPRWCYYNTDAWDQPIGETTCQLPSELGGVHVHRRGRERRRLWYRFRASFWERKRRAWGSHARRMHATWSSVRRMHAMQKRTRRWRRPWNRRCKLT